VATFKNTFASYSASAAAGSDSFGKKTFPQPHFDMADKLYVAAITPVIHYTLGGIRINSDGVALRTDPADGGIRPVRGLYAAGESSGGVHGADRLAGNSLLECVVFGRTAGRHAALPEVGGSEQEL
jgi:succinate dehydrogenase/fumarate reductase flavoprotein subunit